MGDFIEDEGVVTVFASSLNEVCLTLEPGWLAGGMPAGYAAFIPRKARLIAEAILRCADECEADTDDTEE